MVDPTRMVFISGISSLTLLISLLIYKYIYPKKNINLFILIILISILPTISIFRPGDYESGDFNIHLYRSIEFYRSLSEGHFMPSWAGNLNANYGLPLFIFNYTLPYYIICLFHFLSFSFLMSMKLFLAINFILSGIFMYMASRKLFRDDFAALTSTIFYQFAPYHLQDIHFKIVIGEIMIFTLFPVLFYCLLNLWIKKNSLWIALTAVTTALLIVSHVTIALYAMVLLFFYTITIAVNSRKTSIIFTTLLSFGLGCISGVYVLLTPIFLTQYTIVPKMKFVPEFPDFIQLFYSPWRLGFLFQGHKGELPPLIGYSHLVTIIAIIILWLRKKLKPKHTQTLLFWFVSFVCLVFLISPLSSFIWVNTPFLKTTGGAHRLLINVAFVTSIMAGYLNFYIRKNLLWLFIYFTIFSTILNWGQRTVIPGINDAYFIKHLWKSTYSQDGHYFANSKWRSINDPWFSKLPVAYLESVDRPATIVNLQRYSTLHTYIISAPTDLTLKESTLYFPGWQVSDNNKPVVTSPDNQGIITFKVPKGLHYIRVYYKDIFIYKVLKNISIACLSLLSFIIIYNLLIKMKIRNLFKKT